MNNGKIFCRFILLPVLSSSMNPLYKFFHFYSISLMLFFYSGNSICSNPIAETNLTEAKNTIENLPVNFHKNVGQWDSRILFQGNSPGWDANVYFLKNGLSFGFKRPVNNSSQEEEDSYEDIEFLVWNLNFKNSLQNITVEPEGMIHSNTHYFLGNDPKQHKTNVPDYRVIKYKNVYNNIDISYYGNGKELKHDFIVKSGGQISDIQITLDGIKRLSLTENGQLEIHTSWGILLEEIPESFQFINNKKVNKNIKYKIIDNTTYGFEIIDSYNKNEELIIDPVNLLWSTFVGGTATTGNGYLRDIAIDAAGNVYATGWYTNSFPVTPGTYNTNWSGGTGIFGTNRSDVFVFKLDATGSNLIYATYIGSSNNEEGLGIAVNASGEVYITGSTKSSGFPTTTGAYDVTFNGPNNNIDAFFLKLNNNGSTLLYSTFLGGAAAGESGNFIAIANNGDAVITGNTSSSDFPVSAGALQTLIGGAADGFVTKIAPNGAGNADLIFSTFIGGTNGESSRCAIINTSGDIFICGNTSSTNFPVTTGAFSTSHTNSNDVFVAKLNSAGTSLLYSTFIGGSLSEIAFEIDLNNAGEVFITGYTASPDFPVTQGAFDTSFNGGNSNNVVKTDVFVTKLYPAGTGTGDLKYSTFVGGTANDYGSGIAVNNNNEVFVSGYTISMDFPVTSCAYDPTQNSTATSNGGQDLFLFKLNATGSTLQYSTYIGGNDADYADPKVELFGDCDEQVYLSTTTHSPNFPTTAGTFQPSKQNTTWDQPAILTFKARANIGFKDSLISASCNGITVAFTDTSYASCVWDNTWTPGTWQWYFGDGSTSTLQNPTHTYLTNGTYNVKLVITCPKDSIVKTININLPPPVTLNVSANTIICQGSSAILSASATGGTGNYTYSWIPGNASGQSITVSPTSTTVYSVFATDMNGCSSTLQTVTVSIANTPVLLSASSSVSICSGSSAVLSASASGGNGSYNFTWLPVNLNTSSVTVSPSSTSTYTIIANDNCNNTPDSLIITVTVNALPAIFVTADDSTGCPPLCINFYSGNNPSIVQNHWSFGDGAQSSSIGFTNHCYKDPGLYTVSLTVTDNNGCSNSFVKNNWINVYPVPIAAFTSTPKPATILDPTIHFHNQSQGHTSSAWSFGDALNSSSGETNPSFTYSDTGSYAVSLIVFNSYGCSDTANDIVVVKTDFTFYAPNAFTPNNDGLNAEFIPRYTGIDNNNYELMIFDRWGNLIFKTNDPTKGWDGRANGGSTVAQTDTYVWKVRFTDILGDKHQHIGHINLLR